MRRYLARHRARFTAQLQEAQRQAEFDAHCADAEQLFDFNDNSSEPLPPAVDRYGDCDNPGCTLCHPDSYLTAGDIIEAWRAGIDLR